MNRTIRISQFNRQRITEILKIYRDADTSTSSFINRTNLKCPDGCGYCCNNPKITVSILEALPLAYYIVRKLTQEDIDKLLDKLADENKSICTFFKKDPHSDWKGRCSIYKYRFLICRLFGFYRKMDKYGKDITGACKILRETYHLSRFNIPPPLVNSFSIRLLAIGIGQENEFLPINIAIMKAIEYIQFDTIKQSLKEK